MSADNAVLLIKFPDGSCKVTHTLSLMDISPNDDFVNWEVLYNVFAHIKLLPSRDEAEKLAIEILQSYWYVEYGIVCLPLKLNWNEIEEKVKRK